MSTYRNDWAFKEKQTGVSLKALKNKKRKSKSRNKKANKRAKISRQDNSKFFASQLWRELRVRVLEKYECKCMMCGSTPKEDGIRLHVDHIKPRSKYPELSLDFNNLQVLCEDCNLGKSNKYSTDWRPCDAEKISIEEQLDRQMLFGA